jgi:hypothetical protein
MKKLANLWIGFEITRRCNLHCEHCLRGDAEPKTATPFVRERVYSFVNKLYNEDKILPNFCFTGGEPMLVAKQILDMIMRMPEDMLIDIATNGRVWNKYCYPLISTLLADMHGENYIHISNDQWHKKEGIEIRDEWNGERDIYGHAILIRSFKELEDHMVHEGRAIDNGIGKLTVMRGSHFYINVDGNIYDACDYSYNSQREIVPLGTIFDHHDDLMAIAYKVGELEEEE